VSAYNTHIGLGCAVLLTEARFDACTFLFTDLKPHTPGYLFCLLTGAPLQTQLLGNPMRVCRMSCPVLVVGRWHFLALPNFSCLYIVLLGLFANGVAM